MIVTNWYFKNYPTVKWLNLNMIHHLWRNPNVLKNNIWLFSLILMEFYEEKSHFCNRVTVWIQLNLAARFQFHVFTFFFFFFFAWTVISYGFTEQETKITIHILFIIVHALKNIKNGSYGIIYTFKNYFTTVFLVFSFQFQQQ